MKYKLGILGLGKMGNSILSGIIKSNIYNKKEILLYDVNEKIKEELCNQNFIFSESEEQLFNLCDMIIIAIKPQKFNELLKIKIEENTKIIISIAAGKTINELKSIFGNQQYIRVMPNTPAFISCSASAISKGDNVKDDVFEKVAQIFCSIGVVEEIPENKMNEIIPINGSMPAYLYYFVEVFINEAVNKGIRYDVAKSLACEAIIGSAKMILETNKDIKELINDVCSPGGTTIEGLKELEKNDFQEIIRKAYNACVNRAYEL